MKSNDICIKINSIYMVEYYVLSNYWEKYVFLLVANQKKFIARKAEIGHIKRRMVRWLTIFGPKNIGDLSEDRSDRKLMSLEEFAE